MYGRDALTIPTTKASFCRADTFQTARGETENPTSSPTTTKNLTSRDQTIEVKEEWDLRSDGGEAEIASTAEDAKSSLPLPPPPSATVVDPGDDRRSHRLASTVAAATKLHR